MHDWKGKGETEANSGSSHPTAGTQISDQEEHVSYNWYLWTSKMGQVPGQQEDWRLEPPAIPSGLNLSPAPSISGVYQGAAAKAQSGNVVNFTNKA